MRSSAKTPQESRLLFKILFQWQMEQIALNLGLAFVKRIASEGF